MTIQLKPLAREIQEKFYYPNPDTNGKTVFAISYEHAEKIAEIVISFSQKAQDRTPEQLTGWAELLELCEDECQVFSTSEAMREAVINTEKELNRLHEIENLAIGLVRLFDQLNRHSPDTIEWEEAMENLWDEEAHFTKNIMVLVPQAFTTK